MVSKHTSSRRIPDKRMQSDLPRARPLMRASGAIEELYVYR